MVPLQVRCPIVQAMFRHGKRRRAPLWKWRCSPNHKRSTTERISHGTCQWPRPGPSSLAISLVGFYQTRANNSSLESFTRAWHVRPPQAITQHLFALGLGIAVAHHASSLPKQTVGMPIGSCQATMRSPSNVLRRLRQEHSATPVASSPEEGERHETHRPGRDCAPVLGKH
jgi:hypothetical protein